MSQIRLTAAFACGVALLPGGCAQEKLYKPREMASVQEAGEIHIASGMIAPWNGYVDALQPKFTITADAALTASLPKTTFSQSDTYSAFSAGLQIGLAQSGVTQSAVEKVENGTKTDTSTETKTTSPGTLPQSTATGITPPDVSKLGSPNGTVQNETLLAYTAATAIYQEVQLLNGYLKDAAFKRGYVPYIVRLPISIQPYARGEPYDAYIDAAFFAGCEGDSDIGDPTPVVPLLVTDDLETAQATNSAQIANQLALNLGGMVNNAALQANLQKLSQEFQAVLGTDLNSLFSVSRGSADNILHVRIGAARSPSYGYAMTAQTHNVTLIILVKRKFTPYAQSSTASMCSEKNVDAKESPAEMPRVQIMAKTSLRNANTGAELPQDFRALYSSTQEVFSRYLTPEQLDKLDEQQIFKLVNDVRATDSEQFDRDMIDVWKELQKGIPEDKQDDPRHYEQSLWMGLSRIAAASDFVTAFLYIPNKSSDAQDQIDSGQFLVLKDTGEKTTVDISGFGSDAAAQFRARLKCIDDAYIPADSLSRSVVNGPIEIAFPSFHLIHKECLGLSDEKADARAIPKITLEVTHYLEDARWTTDGNAVSGSNTELPFHKLFYAGPGEAAETGFSMVAATDTAIADNANPYSLRLFFSKFGKNLGDITIEASGGTIASLSGSDQAKADSGQGKLSIVEALIKSKAPVVIDLKLQGLTPGRILTIKATGRPKRDVTAEPTSETLMLPIAAGAAQSK